MIYNQKLWHRAPKAPAKKVKSETAPGQSFIIILLESIFGAFVAKAATRKFVQIPLISAGKLRAIIIFRFLIRVDEIIIKWRQSLMDATFPAFKSPLEAT